MMCVWGGGRAVESLSSLRQGSYLATWPCACSSQQIWVRTPEEALPHSPLCNECLSCLAGPMHLSRAFPLVDSAFVLREQVVQNPPTMNWREWKWNCWHLISRPLHPMDFTKSLNCMSHFPQSEMMPDNLDPLFLQCYSEGWPRSVLGAHRPLGEDDHQGHPGQVSGGALPFPHSAHLQSL